LNYKAIDSLQLLLASVNEGVVYGLYKCELDGGYAGPHRWF